MLIDKEQGVQLATAQPGNSRRRARIRRAVARSPRFARVLAICEITRHQHDWLFTAKDQIRQSSKLNCSATLLFYRLFTNSWLARP